MSALWSGVTVDCADPQRLGRFWATLLDRPESEPLPGWVRLDGSPDLNFQPVPEPEHGKARIHLDVRVDDIDEGVTTVTRLGGRPTGERHEYDEGVVVVMADPEGNEFCLVQYFAPTSGR